MHGGVASIPLDVVLFQEGVLLKSRWNIGLLIAVQRYKYMFISINILQHGDLWSNSYKAYEPQVKKHV